MKSPFETLGLLPSLIEELEERQIAAVVKDAAKALQTVFHPDKTAGDSLRSRLINDAASALKHPEDIKDAKEDYLASGPGQREIAEAQIELLTLQSRLAAVEENLLKTSRRTDTAKDPLNLIPKLELDETGETEAQEGATLGLNQLHEGVYADERVIKVPVTLESKSHFASAAVVEQQAIRLRYLPGTKFIIDTSKGMIHFYEDELATLQERTEEKRERMEDDIRIARAALKEMDKTGEKEKGRREATENELQELLGKKENAKQEIANLKKRIKRMKVSSIKEGYIDEDGQIILGKERTGLQVAGCAAADIGTVDNPEFRPFMTVGNYLVAVDVGNERGLGRTKCLGVLQEIEGLKTKKEDPETKAKSAGKRKKARPLPEAERTKIPIGTVEDIYFVSETRATDLVLSKKRRETSENPFEKLGILPRFATELSSDQLRIFVKGLCNGLMKVLHPDAGGNKKLFAEVEQAQAQLNDPKTFENAKKEYAGMVPGGAIISGIERDGEMVREGIAQKISQLAEMKAELTQRELLVKRINMQQRRSYTLIIADLFSNAVHPHNYETALYLRRSEGTELSVLSGDEIVRYTIQKQGFDVFAVLGKHRTRLFGSAPPTMFSGVEDAKEKIDRTDFWHLEKEVHQVLYPEGYLVGLDKNECVFMGLIERIHEGKKVARKMAEGLAKRERKQKRKH